MNPEQVRQLLQMRPFQPFRVLMSSGEIYEIRHPEMVLVTKQHLFIAVPGTKPLDQMPEYAVICSWLHVTAIEFLSPANAT